jgi:phage terminase small subunit
MNTEKPMMTKAEIDKRYTMPDILLQLDDENEGAKKVWYETVPLLCTIHADIKPFLRMLAMYCMATALAERAVTSCAKSPLVVDRRGNAVPNQAASLLKMYCTQQRQYADSLGISIREMKRNQRADKKVLGKRGNNEQYTAFTAAANAPKRNGHAPRR